MTFGTLASIASPHGTPTREPSPCLTSWTSSTKSGQSQSSATMEFGCSRRFSCPAVSECTYEPREVPYATKNMSNTVLYRPGRDEWLELLGEMVQITNEAVRRRASTARDASKPLSLEYMADRIDVDDPLFGYVAVTKDKGWLQGCVLQPTEHRLLLRVFLTLLFFVGGAGTSRARRSPHGIAASVGTPSVHAWRAWPL